MLGVSDSGDLTQGMSYTVIGKLKELRKVAKVTLVLVAWEAAATLGCESEREETVLTEPGSWETCLHRADIQTPKVPLLSWYWEL